MPEAKCSVCGEKTPYAEGMDTVYCMRCDYKMTITYKVEKVEGDAVSYLLHRSKVKTTSEIWSMCTGIDYKSAPSFGKKSDIEWVPREEWLKINKQIKDLEISHKETIDIILYANELLLECGDNQQEVVNNMEKRFVEAKNTLDMAYGELTTSQRGAFILSKLSKILEGTSP
jgi:hypothetical protein